MNCLGLASTELCSHANWLDEKPAHVAQLAAFPAVGADQTEWPFSKPAQPLLGNSETEARTDASGGSEPRTAIATTDAVSRSTVLIPAPRATVIGQVHWADAAPWPRRWPGPAGEKAKNEVRPSRDRRVGAPPPPPPDPNWPGRRRTRRMPTIRGFCRPMSALDSKPTEALCRDDFDTLGMRPRTRHFRSGRQEEV